MDFVQRSLHHLEGVVKTQAVGVPHIIKDIADWEVPLRR